MSIDYRFGLFCLIAEVASIALTARLKSRRLLIAQMSSKEAVLWAASIIASVGLATGCNAAMANRRYLAGSAWKLLPSASAIGGHRRIFHKTHSKALWSISGRLDPGNA